MLNLKAVDFIPETYHDWREISKSTFEGLLAESNYVRSAYANANRYEHVHNGETIAVEMLDGRIFAPPSE